MTESNLVSDGILLMLIGMGTVFVFLSFLVFCTSMLERILGSDKPQPTVSAKATPATPNDEIVAIAAAVHSYRSKIARSLKTKDQK